MDTYDFDLTRLLKNLNDCLDIIMENLGFDYFVFNPDYKDCDQTPLADVQQDFVPNNSGDDQLDQFGTSPFDDETYEYPTNYEFSSDNSGFDPDNNCFYPDNSWFYPDNSVFYPLYGIFYPDNGILYPENGVFYPDTGVFYPDTGVFYPDNGVFYPDNGVFCPDISGLYPDNSGWSAVYFSDESQSACDMPLKIRESHAIDIIDPETGEKLKFC